MPGWPAAAARPGSIVQECAGGLVRIEQSDGLLALLRPHAAQRPQPALLALVTGALACGPAGAGSQVLDNGPRWLALLLPSAELVLGLQPDHARLGDLGRTWAWCTWPPPATPAAPV
jgi:predicted PhzF superfamily epimerase YddE/YHI9